MTENAKMTTKAGRLYLQEGQPKTIEQLFANNDVELYDLAEDPLEMKNLASDINRHGDLIAMMNDKLNLLIRNSISRWTKVT